MSDSKTPITDRHCDAALTFIRETIAARGYPPSRREITEALDMNSSSVGHRVIGEMVKRGLIEVDPSIPRGIRVMVGDAATESM